MAPAPLTHALGLAAEGFRVFPLVKREKLPAIDDFPSRASTDPRRVNGWWTDATGEPEARNIGISTGQGLVVIDFDMKDGQHGAQSLFELVDIQGLPETRTVRTASGGVHLYYRTPPGCRVANSVGKIARNVDVRGEGGYVVAPGSETAAGAYTVEDPRPIADAPDWLIERCGRARDKVESTVPLVDMDSPEAISRAADWLRHHATPSFKGAGGDQAAYKAAAGVKDFGVSETMALELLLEHWNERGSPQWSPERLQVKVENAYAYGSSPAGSVSADAEFGALPPETEKAAPARGKILFAYEAAMSAMDASAEPLIDGMLIRGAMSTLVGPSNVGKSFVALDMAFHVAAGLPWRGREVTSGLAVYVAAEGGASFRKRVRALHDRHGFSEDLPLAVLPEMFDLSKAGTDSRRLVGIVHEAERVSGRKAELVVIDTLSMVMSGDENTAKDVNAFMRCLRGISEATGAHVMVIHHTGKDAAKGARGSTAFRGALDTELFVDKGEVWVGKQRDDAYADPIKFALETVTIGTDSKGRPVTSCVVADPQEFGALPVLGATADALAAFEEWRAHVARMAAVEHVEVRAYPYRTGLVQAFFTDPNRDAAKVSVSTVKRWLDQWESKGLVSKSKRGQWLNAEGSEGSAMAQP